jgi:23S rRNA (cytidine1920-2'-O)/16S rRNA (cytidine1409-2'-O)-methyltransferase
LVLKPKGESICLVKPQFEAGRESVGKKGVVKSPDIHISVLEKSIKQAEEQGLHVKGISFSPIKGPEGNIEYLLYLANSPLAAETDKVSAEDTVRSAHKELHEKGHL